MFKATLVMRVIFMAKNPENGNPLCNAMIFISDMLDIDGIG